MKYLLLFSAIALLSLGQILLKKGVSVSPPEPQLVSLLKTLLNPYVFSGYVFYALSSILALFVLKKFPLSIAFPSMSITYIIILIVSAVFFQEKITLFKLIGITLIMSGVVFLFKSE
ncbi:hypothetical protein KKD62_00100 [Patescibacteria group bacterium]|nr:hypothetical protein [Patescibacteria group bacterium]MBU1931931.1 hypothetical protein [Patescibacteria group bacterium]